MGSSVHVAESVEIARPAADVWAAIADYGFDLKWRKGLTDMTPDPPGPAAMGTKIHEVVRTSGRDYIAETVVTEFDAGSSYWFVGTGTIGALEGGRSVEPKGETASVFTYTVDLRPRGAMRLLRPILGSTVRSNLKRDLQQLKAMMEG
jgi:carbon monoxide dehydrogenase subunit G